MSAEYLRRAAAELRQLANDTHASERDPRTDLCDADTADYIEDLRNCAIACELAACRYVQDSHRAAAGRPLSAAPPDGASSEYERSPAGA